MGSSRLVTAVVGTGVGRVEAEEEMAMAEEEVEVEEVPVEEVPVFRRLVKAGKPSRGNSASLRRKGEEERG